MYAFRETCRKLSSERCIGRGKYDFLSTFLNFIILKKIMKMWLIVIGPQPSYGGNTLASPTCSMTSYGLLEVLLDPGGAHMTSQNKHHCSLHVVLGEWYKNAHNFMKDPKYVWSNYIWALSVILLCILFPLKVCYSLTIQPFQEVLIWLLT